MPDISTVAALSEKCIKDYNAANNCKLTIEVRDLEYHTELIHTLDLGGLIYYRKFVSDKFVLFLREKTDGYRKYVEDVLKFCRECHRVSDPCRFNAV